MSEEKPYKVGYGRPPVEHQFKPGQTGNSGGARSAPAQFSKMFLREARHRYAVFSEGKKRKLTATEITIKAVMNKAMKGDLQAARMVLNYFAISLMEEMTAAGSRRKELSPQQLALLRDVLGNQAVPAAESGSDNPSLKASGPKPSPTRKKPVDHGDDD